MRNGVDNRFRIALRIFGVHDHAEVHRMRSFWEAVSRDLGRQGKTYRDQYVWPVSAQRVLEMTGVG